MSSGRLAGSLTGGRHDKAMYIPDVYVKAQNDWVDNFYKQNGYLGKCMIICSIAIAYSTGFVQTLESPGIKMLSFLAWKVLEKDIGPGKPWKSPGILK